MKTQVLKLNLKRNKVTIVVLLLALLHSLTIVAQDQEVKDILERFSFDYQSDPMFTENQSFGVEVDKVMWSVELKKASDKNTSQMTVQKETLSNQLSIL